MDLLIVPPLTDFTTEVVPPPGASLLDLNERFVTRLADPARLRRTGHDDPMAALFARAAAAVLERGAYDSARLRAVGTALRLARDPAVRLTVDDLELTEGTTQRSADVLAAARRCSLFRPEIEAAARVARGRRAYVLVDGDQQLPAAFALVRALGPDRVTLCGRFAAAHAPALVAIPGFRVRGGLTCRDWSPPRVVRAPWRPAEPVAWIDGTRLPRASGAWAGWLDAGRVAALLPSALSRCRGLTVTVTGFDGLAAATGLDGARADLRPVPDALPEGTPLAFELVAGAPGMAEDAVTAALDRLAGGRAWRLAGLRPYRMPVGATCWGAACRGAPARPDPDLDLARWVPFDAPGTMTPEEVSALIAAWLDRHAAHADLFPGRLAAAALMPAPGRGGPDPYWDPAAQVVEARGDGPDGRGPGTFAVSLRSGRAYRLHPRLVPAVTALAGGDPRALAGLPERARERVLGELTRAGVVRSRA